MVGSITFTILIVLVFLLLSVYILISKPPQLKVKSLGRISGPKEKSEGWNDLGNLGGISGLYRLFGKMTRQKLFGLLLFWELMIVLHLALNQYYVYWALGILLVTFVGFYRVLFKFSKKMQKYYDNPKLKFIPSKDDVFTEKVIALLKIPFYIAVLIAIF